MQTHFLFYSWKNEHQKNSINAGQSLLGIVWDYASQGTYVSPILPLHITTLCFVSHSVPEGLQQMALKETPVNKGKRGKDGFLLGINRSSFS